MSNSAAESFDTCTVCGWRAWTKFNNGRSTCPICGGRVSTGSAAPASPNLGSWTGNPGSVVSPLAPWAEPPAPKPRITTTGLSGYSEHGTPDDWDTAMGTIRGYRWWKIDIPESWAGVRAREVRRGYYDVNGKPEAYDEGVKVLKNSELPRLTGAYSGTWETGKYEARCKNGHTDVPHWKSACGCGIWGYFDPGLPCDQVLSQWRNSARGEGWRSLAVFGSVKGSGRVLVGEKGFRCQTAEIEALAVGRNAVEELKYWNVRIKAERRSDPYGGAWGSGYYPGYTAPLSSGRVTRSQASDSEVQARLAMVEDMLSRAYPGARIVSSEKTLAGLFPPQPGYGAKAA